MHLLPTMKSTLHFWGVCEEDFDKVLNDLFITLFALDFYA